MEAVEVPKHPGYMGDRPLKYVQVTDTLVLHIDPEFEVRRVQFMARMLLAHGQHFPRVKFDDKYPKLAPDGRCYDNAMEVVQQYPGELIYCEGTMVFDTGRGLFAMPHGWCCTPDGQVVDPTCWKLQNDPKVLYLGIPFQLEYAQHWKRLYGFHGMLDGHPTLHDSVGVYVDQPTQWKKALLSPLQEVGLG